MPEIVVSAASPAIRIRTSALSNFLFIYSKLSLNKSRSQEILHQGFGFAYKIGTSSDIDKRLASLSRERNCQLEGTGNVLSHMQPFSVSAMFLPIFPAR
jgi:hypothetical protein